MNETTNTKENGHDKDDWKDYRKAPITGTTSDFDVARLFSDLEDKCLANMSPGRELSLVVTKLQEAKMWAVKYYETNNTPKPETKTE